MGEALTLCFLISFIKYGSLPLFNFVFKTLSTEIDN